MDTKHPTNRSINNKQFQLAINLTLISVMFTCAALIIEKPIQVVYPLWGHYWFPIFTLLLTPASLLIRRSHHISPSRFQNKTLFILSEVVLIILITKAISMIFLMLFGISTLWQEITLWPQEFIPTFFNIDVILRLACVFSIWLLTWLISWPLNKLEEDEILIEQEKQGFTFTDRYDARRKLISIFFFLGVFLILLTVILESIAVVYFEGVTSTGFYVVILLFYFFSGFLFLAVNQFAIMKARWYFNDIDVNPSLASQWLFFSLFFILSIIILVAILPTNLPLGIPEVSLWVAEVFLYIAALILQIIVSPFIFLLTLLSRLFGQETGDQPFMPSETSPDFSPGVTATIPWFDVVRSILFWLIFIGIVLGSIIFYIKNKPNLIDNLRELFIFSWLVDLWCWFSRGVKKTQSAVSDSIQKGVEKLQFFFRNQSEKLVGMATRKKNLQPRQSVINIYWDWILWNQQNGHLRLDSQTPHEYAYNLIKLIPETTDLVAPIKNLTDIFIHARYTRHPVHKDQALLAQEITRQLKTTFNQNPDLLIQNES